MAFHITTQDLLDKESFSKALKILMERLDSDSKEIESIKNDCQRIFEEIEKITLLLRRIEVKVSAVSEIHSAKVDNPSSLQPAGVLSPKTDKPQKKQIAANQKTEKSAVKSTPKRKFYARYSPTQDILVELPDNMRGQASFVAEVCGDKGTVSFNQECLEYALSSLSSAIYPFFDYDMQTDSPKAITQKNSVEIEHISGNQWKMSGKISLIIT